VHHPTSEILRPGGNGTGKPAETPCRAMLSGKQSRKLQRVSQNRPALQEGGTPSKRDQVDACSTREWSRIGVDDWQRVAMKAGRIRRNWSRDMSGGGVADSREPDTAMKPAARTSSRVTTQGMSGFVMGPQRNLPVHWGIATHKVQRQNIRGEAREH
jgi:hypothetical protein